MLLCQTGSLGFTAMYMTRVESQTIDIDRQATELSLTLAWHTDKTNKQAGRRHGSLAR